MPYIQNSKTNRENYSQSKFMRLYEHHGRYKEKDASWKDALSLMFYTE